MEEEEKGNKLGDEEEDFADHHQSCLGSALEAPILHVCQFWCLLVYSSFVCFFVCFFVRFYVVVRYVSLVMLRRVDFVFTVLCEMSS